MLQACPFAKQVEQFIFSGLSPVQCQFHKVFFFVCFRFLYRIEPVARKLFTFWKIVFVLGNAHQKMFVLIYEYVVGKVGMSNIQHTGKHSVAVTFLLRRRLRFRDHGHEPLRQIGFRWFIRPVKFCTI
jgi:hypothetical protein